MTSDEIFRYVNVRPVQRVPEDEDKRRFASYDGDNGQSPLHRAVAALPREGARQAATDLARRRLAVDDDASLPPKLTGAVEEASQAETAREAVKILEEALDQTPEKYLRSEVGKRLRDALWDRLYAHTLAPEKEPNDREEVLGEVRTLHFMKYLVGQRAGDAPLSPSELREVRPTIPPEVLPPVEPAEETRDEEHLKYATERVRAVHREVEELQAAIEDLTSTDRVHRDQLSRTVVDVSTTPPPAMLLSGPAVLRGCAGTTAGERGEGDSPDEQTVVVPKRPPWVFGEFAERNLSEETRQTLAARRDALKGLEFTQVTAALEAEQHALVEDFVTDLPQVALQAVRAEPDFTALMRRVAVANTNIVALNPQIFEPPAAASRGIRPLGVGDLLVVRQEVTNYETGELAHVENVMASEHKTRTHSRLRETEDILVTEAERTEESEKDLQTTERFELQKESQKTIEMEMSLDTGLGVSASYGPVSITAHADFALSQSSSEASRTASTYAKQVTERSVARIKERTRTERTARTLERFEERNKHGFENSGPEAEHIIGVFRWIDKYYQARLINYGRRMMFEFIVPEPAAFYLAVQAAQPLTGVTQTKPDPPMMWGRPLQPSDLTKYNYMSFVAKYSAEGVEAYPDEVERVSAAFAEATAEDRNGNIAKSSEKLVVPDGYESESVYGYFNWMGYPNNFADCFVGGHAWPNVAVSGVQGVIPISVKGWVTGFHVNVVAICRIKPETIAKWQVKAYEGIMNAYERQLADYNEQVAAALVQAGVNIQGRNPEVNRRIEKDELRKEVLRLLTDDFAATRVAGAWRFSERFDAMQQNGPYGFPDFDTGEAAVEGSIIQFFEQAFEWTNMTYRFYPYFWGRREEWKDTFPLSDPDPLFVDFLRAGSARVIVPVQPSYDDTVLHYLATNEIWNGGTPPTLNDPLYRSIVAELKADAGTDLDEVTACQPGGGTYPCLVDEWEVKLPTDLVYLQEDAELPTF